MNRDVSRRRLGAGQVGSGGRDRDPAEADPSSTVLANNAFARKPTSRRRRLVWMVLLAVFLGVAVRWGMPTLQTFQGERSLQQGQWADASDYFQSALSWHPGKIDAVQGAIRASRKRGDLVTAEQLISDYQAESSANVLTRIQKDLLLIQQGIKLTDDGFIAGLLTKYPQFGPEILEAVILGFQSCQQYRQAKFYAEQWLEGASDDPWGQFYLAICESQLGELEASKARLIQASQYAPLYLRICVELARIDMKMENHGEAIELLHPVIANDPESTELRLLKCTALLSLRRQQEAVDELHQVLRIDPRNFGATISLATQLIEQKKMVEAIYVLKPIVSQYSHDLSVNYLLAQAYFELGEHSLSQRYLNSFVEGRKAVDQLLLKRRQLERDGGSSDEWLGLVEGYLKYRWEEAGPMLLRASAGATASARLAAVTADFNAKLGKP